uniref:Integrator complex subunit 4/Protein SIEL C-terminal Ig-like domain-containing protein n=1 Tax=Caenorhabditis japonica TaxID=281687 RepID=A0A8R1IE86_CAEJA
CESVFCSPRSFRVGAALTDEKSKIITPATVAHLLDKSIPQLPPKLPPVSSIHLKFARITSPNKDTAVEQVLRFFANLPHGIPLEFQLYNMREEDLEAVRIKTIHPDGKADVMKPRVEEFKSEGKCFSVSTQ